MTLQNKNIIEKIALGAADIISEELLDKKLSQNKPLRIKFGADPTAANLHLGHVVVFSKLRQLQDMGHHIIFLIGDFTARIGDPSGKSKTRPPLSEEEIAQNVTTYVDQVCRLLDKDKITITYNSHWLGKLDSTDWIKLCGKITLARIIERDDFSQRLLHKTPIGMHELLYPIMQGYDSVELKADIELGGTDQTFNMLVGRHLQDQYNQEPQVVITMPLLEGLDGVQKMSKSLKNDIGLTDTPDQVFGKIMSLSDDMMWKYYKLLLLYSEEKINHLQHAKHPKNAKKDLAFSILKKFWSEKDAQIGKKSFEDNFEKKNFKSAKELICKNKVFTNIIDLIVHADPSLSKSQARRLLRDNAISINEQKVKDESISPKISCGDILKIGKHRIYMLII